MSIYTIIAIFFGVIFILLLSGCKPTPDPIPEPNPEPEPEPNPEPIYDPLYWKWQLVNETTPRWVKYLQGMKYITSDTLMALEMTHYNWVSDWDLFHKEDYWDLPDEVYENKMADCDGLARLTADGLGRFAKISEVWWCEFYGYYRYYYLDEDKWIYDIELGGHAITVYERDGKLTAFSNTSWWVDKDFQDHVDIGELTFPEGIILIRCRHWETGKLQWVIEAPQGEILEGSCIFDREKKVV